MAKFLIQIMKCKHNPIKFKTTQFKIIQFNPTKHNTGFNAPLPYETIESQDILPIIAKLAHRPRLIVSDQPLTAHTQFTLANIGRCQNPQETLQTRGKKLSVSGIL